MVLLRHAETASAKYAISTFDILAEPGRRRMVGMVGGLGKIPSLMSPWTSSRRVAGSKSPRLPETASRRAGGYRGTLRLRKSGSEPTAGVKIVSVPYKGAAPALTDLLAGQVDIMFANLASALAHIRAGQVRAPGVASERRNVFLPNVPTMSEAMPGFVSVTWFGVVAPPGTPPEIANTLSAAIAEALKLPDVAKRIADLSVEPIGNTPAEMAAFMKEEVERWGKVIRAAGAKAD